MFLCSPSENWWFGIGLPPALQHSKSCLPTPWCGASSFQFSTRHEKLTVELQPITGCEMNIAHQTTSYIISFSLVFNITGINYEAGLAEPALEHRTVLEYFLDPINYGNLTKLWLFFNMYNKTRTKNFDINNTKMQILILSYISQNRKTKPWLETQTASTMWLWTWNL